MSASQLGKFTCVGYNVRLENVNRLQKSLDSRTFTLYHDHEQITGSRLESDDSQIKIYSGQPVDDDLITYLETRRVGDRVALTILREDREQEIVITLEARPVI